MSDALASVQQAVAALLATVTSGTVGGVVPQVTSTLTSLVNLAVSTVLGGGLPAPDPADLPTLPALPVAPPELPVAPPVTAPELPLPARSTRTPVPVRSHRAGTGVCDRQIAPARTDRVQYREILPPGVSGTPTSRYRSRTMYRIRPRALYGT
ncbi:hypothetical protein O1L60_24645 [Streptomyces diastatochromogenes]|nr:hypothetical protein [Streptomyces diastatochromogenes]